jgi:adenylate cyclase
MAIEIERKFLVTSNDWMTQTSDIQFIRQGYLLTDPDRTVRVRVTDNKGFITIKGRSEGIARVEIETGISAIDAEELLLLIDPTTFVISKTRYIIPFGLLNWEVDVFTGANAGLIVAELELPSVDFGIQSLPDWIGKEVSDDLRYCNSALVRHPFTHWEGRPV